MSGHFPKPSTPRRAQWCGGTGTLATMPSPNTQVPYVLQHTGNIGWSPCFQISPARGFMRNRLLESRHSMESGDLREGATARIPAASLSAPALYLNPFLNFPSAAGPPAGAPQPASPCPTAPQPAVAAASSPSPGTSGLGGGAAGAELGGLLPPPPPPPPPPLPAPSSESPAEQHCGRGQMAAARA